MINTFSIVSQGADETHTIGFNLGLNAQAGDLILMTGELGTGKTTMTQGIAEGLGIAERPRSPTFVMATEYMGRLPLYHIDLYRVVQALELNELGVDEYVSAQGVTIIEWADRAPEMFLSDCLWISLDAVNDETRHVKLVANASRYLTYIASLRAKHFVAEND